MSGLGLCPNVDQRIEIGGRMVTEELKIPDEVLLLAEVLTVRAVVETDAILRTLEPPEITRLRAVLSEQGAANA